MLLPSPLTQTRSQASRLSTARLIAPWVEQLVQWLRDKQIYEELVSSKSGNDQLTITLIHARGCKSAWWMISGSYFSLSNKSALISISLLGELTRQAYAWTDLSDSAVPPPARIFVSCRTGRPSITIELFLNWNFRGRGCGEKKRIQRIKLRRQWFTDGSSG